MVQKPLSYSNIFIGMIFPEIEFEISEERVKKYTEAIEDFNPLYFENQKALQNGFPSKIAPPTIGALFTLKIYDSLGGLPGGMIHAKQKFRLKGPVYVGETIRISGKVVAKHIKRRRQYVEVETQSYNELKELVITGISTFIWP